MGDEYLLQRDNVSKVVIEKVPNLDTNASSLDKTLVREHLQVYTEVIPRSNRVLRQLD